MEKYYKKEENKFYYEGQAITRQTKGGLFSGIPSTEQLEEWGYEKVEEPKRPEPSEEEKAAMVREQRMQEIKLELAELDYLTHKEADGEDMSAYNELYGGNWHAYRRALRLEYNTLEAEQ